MYGKRDRKLLKKMKINKEINMNVVLLFLLIRSDISWCNFIVILFISVSLREGKNQNFTGKNKIPIIALIQFKDKFIILEWGSKIENKLFIIFS